MAWLFYLGLAIAGGIWLSVRHGDFPLGAIAPASWWRELPLGLAAGGVLLAAWEGMRRFLPAAVELEQRLAEVMAGLSRGDTVVLGLISGFAEELFFRGAVQGAFGLTVATLLFALLHPGPGRSFFLWMVFAGAAGLLLGALVLWRGNLLAAMVAHATVNVINLGRLARKGQASPEPA
ncbi:MAG TPA: CPBP family intramembrane glutamic endopeptidase [Thermoanaerobaculia bacterium]|nr:CPBP family intramembrane glutamic endopeptidase [Thermoanaerobaculia bacterium]